MQLKPQDFLVSLKLLVLQRRGVVCTYQELAAACGLGVSDTHGAVKRAFQSRLLTKSNSSETQKGGISGYVANAAQVAEFAVHGLKFVWPGHDGGIRSGMPTGVAVVGAALDLVDNGTVQVWPTDEGKVRGAALLPWHDSLPTSGSQDEELYHLLALIDVIRVGGARARALAERAFRDRVTTRTIARMANIPP